MTIPRAISDHLKVGIFRRVRSHLQRGAVLVEASIVTVATVLIALGGISVSAIGYARVSSDGAAFIAVRTYAQALSAANGSSVETADAKQASSLLANNVVKELIPGANAVQMDQIAIPNAGIGVNPDKNFYNKDARHGGATLVVPQGQQSTVSVQTNGIFGSPTQVSVSGIGMEPDMMILAPAFNIVGDPKYSGVPDPNNTLKGPVKYFGTAMDLPPYFYSHNYGYYCNAIYSWNSCEVYHYSTYFPVFRAYGVAELLDTSNWSNPIVSINQGSPNQANVFSAMLCHQRVYAHIARNFFPPADPYTAADGRHQYPSYPATGTKAKQNAQYTRIYNDPFTEEATFNVSDWKNQPFRLVRSWDLLINAGTQVDANTKIGTYAVHPLRGCDVVDTSY